MVEFIVFIIPAIYLGFSVVAYLYTRKRFP